MWMGTLINPEGRTRQVDAPNRRIEVALPNVPLEWCRGSVPVGAESIDMEWWREGEELQYRVRAPMGFAVHVTNASGLEAVRHV